MGKSRGKSHRKRGDKTQQTSEAESRAKSKKQRKASERCRAAEGSKTQSEQPNMDTPPDVSVNDFEDENNTDEHDNTAMTQMDVDPPNGETSCQQLARNFAPSQVRLYEDKTGDPVTGPQLYIGDRQVSNQESRGAYGPDQDIVGGGATTDSPSLSDLADYDRQNNEQQRMGNLIIIHEMNVQSSNGNAQLDLQQPPSEQSIPRNAEIQGMPPDQQQYPGPMDPQQQAMVQPECGDVSLGYCFIPSPQETNEKLMEYIQRLKTENDELKQRLQHVKDMADKNAMLQNACKQLETQLQCSCTEKAVVEEKYQCAIADLGRTSEEAKVTSDTLNEKLRHINTLEQQLERGPKKLKDQLKETDKRVKAQDKELKRLNALVDQKERVNQELLQRNVEIQQELVQERQNVQRCNEAIANYNHHLKVYEDNQKRMVAAAKQRDADHQRDMGKLKEQLFATEEECRSLSLRLSKFAGAQLVYNNPNIADLSDANRPTKLGEQFSELYDNEWTDSFEELHSYKDLMNEVDTTQYMLCLLQRAYNLCREITTAQMDAINKSATSVTITMEISPTKSTINAESPEKGVGEADGDNSGEMTDAGDINQDTGEADSGKISKDCSQAGGGNSSMDDSRVCPDDQNDASGEEKMEQETAEGNPHVDPTGGNSQPPGSNDGDNNHNMEQESTESNSHVEGPDTSSIKLGLVSDDEIGGIRKDMEQGDIPRNPKADQHEVDATGAAGDPASHGSDSNAPKVPENSSVTDNNALDMDEHQPGAEVTQETPQQPVADSIDNGDAAKAEKSDVTKVEKSTATEETDNQETCVVSFNEDVLSVEQKKQIWELGKFSATQLQKEVVEKLAEKIQREFNINEEYPCTITYIKGCLKLCWLMSLHKPPVVIGFTEVKADTPFSTEQYKAYTKNGKWLDFVVWPPLYLHEGGAMLSKGTAQGKKNPN